MCFKRSGTSIQAGLSVRVCVWADLHGWHRKPFLPFSSSNTVENHELVMCVRFICSSTGVQASVSLRVCVCDRICMGGTGSFLPFSCSFMVNIHELVS